MSKYLLIIVSVLLSVNLAFSQDLVVTGVITDGVTGETIPGATVLQKGTGNGTVTDFDGKFKLSISGDNPVLVVSFVGYETQEVTVGNQTNFTIVLQEESTQLTEVVVIGYGTQKKKVVTGAIESVSAEEITSTPILRAEQALQGRTAGVQVTNQSGQPGEAPNVLIRGAGTTGNSAPVYVVDGLLVGNIEYLNPGDIESIDVLKDAASAAIYGTRAANGVVLITTKSGTKGKMNVTYDGYYGIQNTASTIEMLGADDYKMLMNEGARNAGMTEPFDLNEISAYDTDWQSELYQKNAPMTNHQVTVAGGSDKSTFSASVSYFAQQGIIGGDKSQFERITGRLNTTHQVNKVFSFGNNLAYTRIVRKGISSNTSFNGALSSALNIDPLTPVFETDAGILAQPPYSNEPVVSDGDGQIYGISNYIGAEIVNPLALIELANGGAVKDEIVGNVYGEFEVIDGLKFKTDLGINVANGINEGFTDLFYLNGAQNNTDKTRVSRYMYRFFMWQWENTITYTKKIGEHNIGVLAGTSARLTRYDDLSGSNAKVPTTDPNNVYLNLATDTVWQASGGASEYALASLFGRVTYDYKDRYSLTAIIRRDGSSNFGSNNRYGIFPSIGVAWIASDESFMQNLGPLELLKFRFSWGVNGNDQIGANRYVSTLTDSRWYTYAGGSVIGTSPEYMANKEVAWEESEQLDVAVDLAFYNNRLTATIDYYIKETHGLLETLPITGTAGIGAPTVNAASAKNNGVEFSINWRENRDDLSYSVGVNAAYNKNRMTKINSPIQGASWAIAGPVTRAELDQPIAYFYGWETDGIFQNQGEVFRHINSQGEVLQPNAVPGDVRFVDVNGDGTIDDLDRTFIGSPHPDWTLGVNGSVNYKDFDFSFLMTGALGQEIFAGYSRVDLRYTNRSVSALDRWTGEGTSNTVPRYTWSDVNNNYRVSDLYIQNGSFVRLKNIQIGYTLPKSLLEKIGSSSWRFYVSAENLLTFTSYDGVDPEIGAVGTFDVNIDRGVYPQARTFRFGTSLTF